MAAPMKLRVLELYSGIGGMHYALRESGIEHEVVAAVDINTAANEIYQHNFPNSRLLQRSIESLSVKELSNLKPDMILMSPPCQPFCRVGKQLDTEDPRTKSFLHLLNAIPKLTPPPQYILVENVRGFDTSLSRTMLLDMLRENQYHVQEFLLSPLQFGIPNSRLRYYLLAKKTPFQFKTKDGIRDDIPDCLEDYLIHKLSSKADSKAHLENPAENSSEQTETGNGEPQAQTLPSGHINNQSETSTQIDQSEQTLENCDLDTNQSKQSEEEDDPVDNQSELPLYEKHKHLCRPLKYYIEQKDQEYFEQFMIPDKFLKRFWVMDIVTEENRNSCCFTKRYGHHIEGAGSVVQTNLAPVMNLASYKEQRVYTEEVERAVCERGLRFFTPREIANLMCFPQEFELPVHMKSIQGYRVLGNSLNVHVVASLIRLLLHSGQKL